MNPLLLIDKQKKKYPISESLHASVSKRVLMHNHSNGNELRILMQIKLISLTIVEHQDSLQNRDKQQLGNGLLGTLIYKTTNLNENIMKNAASRFSNFVEIDRLYLTYKKQQNYPLSDWRSGTAEQCSSKRETIIDLFFFLLVAIIFSPQPSVVSTFQDGGQALGY